MSRGDDDIYMQGTGLEAPPQPDDLRDWLQTFGLTKKEDYLIDPAVEHLCMGLGWDVGVDVDASAALFNQDCEVVDLVWWRKLKSDCRSVLHSGDDRTGEGSGDDEVISVDLRAVPLHVHHILFTVCIYSRGISFNQVRSAYVRMMHGKPKYNGHVLCSYSLTDMEGYAMLMGLLTRKGAYWNFRALGLPATGRTIDALIQDPENLICLSEVTSVAPEFRRISVQVVQGSNLAAKDTGMFSRKRSSDPYFIIRFREKSYKSQTIKKTLKPVWNAPSLDLGVLTETEPKSVKIDVFDYDGASSDDFMGQVVIPAKLLFHLGPGHHKLSFDLGPSKNRAYRKEEVSGQLFLTVSVTDEDRPSRVGRESYVYQFIE